MTVFWNFLDSSDFFDEAKHQEMNDLIGDLKDEVEFMISELRDAIDYIDEAKEKSSQEENDEASRSLWSPNPNTINQTSVS